MRKNRGGNKMRTNKPLRPQDRNNCITDGVYNNNYFMHAATSHVGAVVKVETVQGAVYEGVFKTFSHDFDVVLELAHKVDSEDPEKLNANEIVDYLIFQCKDIVNMCASNVELEYAYNTATADSFLTDTNISKFNGEVSGEKDLQPWEDPMCNGGEECDLESTDTQNGWDVNEMFSANKKFGVQTTYDESLSDYTCQIDRKDTKDFKEEEAKAARIAMEIERNPSSQNRSLLENGDNEEDLYAAVTRPGNDSDGTKYVPPARRNTQQHRTSGGSNRMNNYSPNGNSGRPPKNNAVPQRYMHQTSQQYHAPSYGAHSSTMRDGANRSSSDMKNSQTSSTNASQSQNIPSYSSASVHGQRSYASNAASVANHSQQNAPIQQSKSQRTSPISVNTLPNGNSDYQPKSLPPVSPSPSHQYHNQNQQSQNQGGNNVLNAQQQRKHQSHHQHTNSRVREDQINELKKFGSEFNLRDAGDGGKPIQVVSNRNKSPPAAQTVVNTERNVVPVTIVSTLPQFTTSGPITSVQAILAANTTVLTTSALSPATPLTQVGLKQPPLGLQQPASYQQGMQVQQQQMMPHQGVPMSPSASLHPAHHPQSMQPPPQQTIIQQKPTQKMHPQGVLPPQAPGQIPHPANTPQQTKSVINVQNQSVAAVTGSVPQQPVVTQSAVPQPGGVNAAQTGVLPLNMHSRQPLQQQQPPLKAQTSTMMAPSELPHSPSATEGAPDIDSVKGKDGDAVVDDISQRVKNVRLNPDAKEYIPAVKSFTPVSRSPSTPTQSRPHTPQTPSSYNIHPGNTPVAAGIQMMMPAMPAYVVASPAGYVPPPSAQSRIRKVPTNSHRTSEFHPSNIPVSAVTGQPLLAPPVPLPPSHLGHGTSFSVPAYTHHPQLAASHYQSVQMIRMVPPGSVVPLVPSTIGYHDSSGTNATAVYVNQGNSAAVAMSPHTHQVHHQQHPPPSTAPSPSQTPQGPAQSHTPNSYQHPPLAAQSASPYTSIMCPVIQAPPTHGPPHMVAAQAQPHTVQQYMTQHPSVNPAHILSIIPHSCS